jgi:hypothetical protein
MTARKPRKPAGLGPEGAALWGGVVQEMADDGLVLDARERRWLLDAAREADMIKELMAAMVGAPFMVRGSQGQDVAHPLIGELRQHRQTLAALLARVKLDDPREAAGTGTGSRTTSTQARTAALTRHHGVR